MTTVETVTQYYQKTLFREPDEVGLDSFVAAVDSGLITIDEVRSSIVTSQEAELFINPVIRLYQAVFGREPDAAGLNGFVDAVRGGELTIEQVAAAMVASREFTETIGTSEVNEAFLENLYMTVLGRSSDPEGLSDFLASGLGVAEIYLIFSEGQEFMALTAVAIDTFLDEAGLCTQNFSGPLIEFTTITTPTIITPTITTPTTTPTTTPGGPVNSTPAVSLSNQVTTISEGANTTARTKVADITVTDDGLGQNDLTLDGADAALFEIEGMELFLKADAALDFDANAALDVTVTVDDATLGATPDDTASLSIVVGRVLEAVELNAFEAGTGPGFVINGAGRDDRSGRSVSNAGDVNGDGFDDLIVGAPYADPNDNDSSGSSYVVFGREETTAIELSVLEAGAPDLGFVINGAGGDDRSGRSVSGAGDVNGDGFDDLIVGGPRADPNGNAESGTSYVVFGGEVGKTIELSVLEAGAADNGLGFVINGVDAGDISGRSVSGAGDVNGDGFDDLIVGAELADPNGRWSGSSYVVFGREETTAIELSVLEAGAADNGLGFVINGVFRFDQSGASVSGAGDVNGDGFDDLIVGADLHQSNGPFSGSSYVVFGREETTAIELSVLEAGAADNGLGFVINGAADRGQSGISVSSAGDVNGDGLDDLIVGAVTASPNVKWSGASYVVFGRTETTAIELSDLNAGAPDLGFAINGADEEDFSGTSVSSAGDVNGDGFDDLIVGAHSADPNGNVNSGTSYVVFGGEVAKTIELSVLDAGAADSGVGFVINGAEANDFLGVSVSGAGDVNGDGFDDLIVGTPYADPKGQDSGSSYVIFGGDDIDASAATLVGTDGAEVLDGTQNADRIIAGDGNDIITGFGGNDHLVGARGDDIFVFADGSGEDVIRDFKDGDDRIDLSAFAIADFAALAITDGGKNIVIQFDADDSVTLVGIDITDLAAADFVFV